MIITCPECKARYNVKEDLVPDKGKSVRCKKCKTAFRAFVDGTSQIIAEKKKAVLPTEPGPGVQTNGKLIHSTVRVDASALQEAMRKQFQKEQPQPKAAEKSFAPKSEAEPRRKSTTDFDPFENMQDSDEFAQVSQQEEPEENSPVMPGFFDEPPSGPEEAFQTRAHKLVDFGQVPDPVKPKPKPRQDPMDDDLNLDHVFPTSNHEDEDPFGDDDANSEFKFSDEEDEASPLSDSGNFGFDKSEEFRPQQAQKFQEPSLFDSLDPEEGSPFESTSLEIPEEPGMPEENYAFEAEIEVPDPADMARQELFDVTIDGTVYPKIDMPTLNRWIKEGRLLETDLVSVSGKSKYSRADSFNELQSCFKTYFNSAQPAQKTVDQKKKKGFFARLFGR